jgi:hypothetical protein
VRRRVLRAVVAMMKWSILIVVKKAIIPYNHMCIDMESITPIDHAISQSIRLYQYEITYLGDWLGQIVQLLNGWLLLTWLSLALGSSAILSGSSRGSNVFFLRYCCWCWCWCRCCCWFRCRFFGRHGGGKGNGRAFCLFSASQALWLVNVDFSSSGQGVIVRTTVRRRSVRLPVV